jgi:AAA+ superfamily predicted ATPase
MNSSVEPITKTVGRVDHIDDLEKELGWLSAVVQYRLSGNEIENILFIPPQLDPQIAAYSAFVIKWELSTDERLILALTLAVHLRPTLFDSFITDKKVHQLSRICRSDSENSLLPTAETALFLLAGNDLRRRLKIQTIFEPEHLFYKESVIDLGETSKGQSMYDGVLSLSSAHRDLFVTNKYRKPRFSTDFPAHLLTTKLEWDDMILAPQTREKLEEMQAYLDYYNLLVGDWGMAKHARNGCRILFYGESGTGKTLAASLIGKHLGRDVYRVDISAVTSKYIGETTKRLDSLFNIAESKGWIIFIDEGDALLGQRKSTDSDTNQNSHYANQDVAFLLQRIENFDGTIIVATNLKNNIDQAFTRRFQAMIRFYVPNEEGMLELWKRNLPAKCPLAENINLLLLIKRYPLTPASVINVIFRASVLALKNKQKEITLESLELCLKDESFKYAGRQQMAV